MTRAATLTSKGQVFPGQHPESGAPWKDHVLEGVRSLRRNRLLRDLYVRLFRAMQSIGLSITPVHFYFPVPDLQQLEVNIWPDGPGESVIDFNMPAQIERLTTWRQYSDEWNFADRQIRREYEFHFNNGFFETVDAEVAYSVVRHTKPRHIVEIGSGNTTRLLASALRRNSEDGVSGELISIDPDPSPILRHGFPGFSKLIVSPVQRIPPEFFDHLDAGDILFFDSSHVVALGSDVVYEILEILPRVKPGVLVHFHDIFVPAEYPRKFVMNNLCFWGEQYMLQAFLCGNRQFRVIWSSSMMQFAHPKILRSCFPNWQGSYSQMPPEVKRFVPTFDGQNVWPCSLWIEKTCDNSQR